MNQIVELFTEDEKMWHIEDTYVRIPRSVMLDTSEGLITPNEFLVLIWLTFQANPHNALVSTSYDGIVAELGITGKNATNKVNKIMLSLKQKKYLWYRNIQGQKRGFRVAINNYLLSNNRIKDLSFWFENMNGADVELNSREIASRLLRDYESTTKEHPVFTQKLNENNVLKANRISSTEKNLSRSTNKKEDKDQEIENENENSYQQFFQSVTSYKYLKNKEAGIKVLNYQPKNDIEKQLKEIAIELAEEKMDFILSAFAKNGMPTLMQVLRETQQCFGYNSPTFNRGKKFNYLLQQVD